MGMITQNLTRNRISNQLRFRYEVDALLYLSELEVFNDGLDLLGLAVLQVEDGTLSALTRRSSLGTS